MGIEILLFSIFQNKFKKKNKINVKKYNTISPKLIPKNNSYENILLFSLFDL